MTYYVLTYTLVNRTPRSQSKLSGHGGRHELTAGFGQVCVVN